MSEVKKQLINNLPSHLRDHPNVESLFGAIGDLLDDMKDDIEGFQYHYDYERIRDSNFDKFAQNMGVNYPRNLAKENKKILLRDIIAVYRAKGTEKAIKQLFKLVGWKVDIEYLWVKKGAQNKEFIYPSDYYFGPEVLYDDGYVYADVTDASNQEYNKVQIVGQNYDPSSTISKFQLIKTPYIKVVVTAEDYKLFTQDFVDAEGNVFEFTETEKFEIVQEIFDFFFESGRPAHVAIIEIATPFRLDDEVTLSTSDSSNIEDKTTEGQYYTEVGEYDSVTINAESAYDPTRVYFSAPFEEPPVVVAFTQSNNEAAIAYARVTNVTKDYFDVFLDSEDGSVLNKNEVVTYFAVVPGVHTLDDGLIIEADTHSTDTAHREGDGYMGDTISFNASFSSAPAVIATLQSRNVEAFTATSIHGVTTSDFKLQQEKLGTGTNRETEDIGWIAFSLGEYTINKSKLTVKASDENIGDVATSYNFSNITFSQAPYLLAHGRTGNDTDGYIIRSDNLTDTSVDFFAQEDTIGDTETGHSGEAASYVAIEWTGDPDITHNRIYEQKTEQTYLSAFDDAPASLDGTVTFDYPMTRFTNFGEYHGNFKLDDPDFSVYTTYPSSEYVGRIYTATETGTQDVIPVSDEANLKLTLGSETTVYLYKVIDSRFAIADDTRSFILQETIQGPQDEYTTDVRYAIGVALNISIVGDSYGLVSESATSTDDYGLITTSSDSSVDLGLVSESQGTAGFAHIQVAHHTPVIDDADYHDTFNDDEGLVEHHPDFYVTHGLIDNSASDTWDFGTIA